MNTISLNDKLFRESVPSGGMCIDATAGNGHDTAALCKLAGPEGKVLAFDIQPQAVENTHKRLTELGLKNCEVILDSHANMGKYARPGTVDFIAFNLGWLPGGDHSIFTHPDSTIAAIKVGLELLRDGGKISLSIYYGGQSGYEERDALLEYLASLEPNKYTVLLTRFYNRTGDVPISAVMGMFPFRLL